MTGRELLERLQGMTPEDLNRVVRLDAGNYESGSPLRLDHIEMFPDYIDLVGELW